VKAAGWLGGCLLALLLLELSLQGFYRVTVGDWLFRRTAVPIFEADPVRCYRLKADLAFPHRTPEFAVTVYTNHQGLRTDARRLPLELDRRGETGYRLLFLGPSYSFGWGNEFEQSYAALITDGLRSPGRRLEAVNLGTPGQTVGMQLCWLRAFGSRLRPDLVVQTVFGNARLVHTACPERLSCPLVEDGFLVPSLPRWRRRLGEAAKRSAAVFYAWWIQRRHPGTAERLAGLDGSDLPDEPRQRLADEPTERTTARYVEHVRSARSYAGAQARTAFVFVPPSFVVHPEDLGRWGGMSPDEAAEVPALAARVQEGLRGEGVIFIDTTPALRRAAARERLYYWLDTHLNPAGNRVVAEAVVERLRAVVEAATWGAGSPPLRGARP
jgi:lysophospholipase L1-like esterase